MLASFHFIDIYIYFSLLLDYGNYYNGPFTLTRSITLSNYIRPQNIQPQVSVARPENENTTPKTEVVRTKKKNNLVSPCPGIFQYGENVFGEHFGKIILRNNPSGKTRVKIIFAVVGTPDMVKNFYAYFVNNLKEVN